MSAPDSVFPALRRLWRWAPLRWAVGAIATGAATLVSTYVVPWATSRADHADVVKLRLELSATRGELSALRMVVLGVDDYPEDAPPIVKRISADEKNARALYWLLVGYVAADSEPRRARKMAAARKARERFDDFVDVRHESLEVAYRKALEYGPPR